jgi:hypothetical protein
MDVYKDLIKKYESMVQVPESTPSPKRSSSPKRVVSGQINAKDKINGLNIFEAAQRGNVKVLRAFLESGVDPSVPDLTYYNWTPLHYASSFGQSRAVKVLLEYGADPDLQDLNGKIPRALAIDSFLTGKVTWAKISSFVNSYPVSDDSAPPDIVKGALDEY